MGRGVCEVEGEKGVCVDMCVRWNVGGGGGV